MIDLLVLSPEFILNLFSVCDINEYRQNGREILELDWNSFGQHRTRISFFCYNIELDRSHTPGRDPALDHVMNSLLLMFRDMGDDISPFYLI